MDFYKIPFDWTLLPDLNQQILEMMTLYSQIPRENQCANWTINLLILITNKIYGKSLSQIDMSTCDALGRTIEWTKHHINSTLEGEYDFVVYPNRYRLDIQDKSIQQLSGTPIPDINTEEGIHRYQKILKIIKKYMDNFEKWVVSNIEINNLFPMTIKEPGCDMLHTFLVYYGYLDQGDFDEGFATVSYLDVTRLTMEDIERGEIFKDDDEFYPLLAYYSCYNFVPNPTDGSLFNIMLYAKREGARKRRSDSGMEEHHAKRQGTDKGSQKKKKKKNRKNKSRKKNRKNKSRKNKSRKKSRKNKSRKKSRKK